MRQKSGVNHPPPSSVEVKERVQLYLYSPWAFLAYSRANFTFTLHLSAKDDGADVKNTEQPFAFVQGIRNIFQMGIYLMHGKKNWRRDPSCSHAVYQ
jgi:hypothetical protein